MGDQLLNHPMDWVDLVLLCHVVDVGRVVGLASIVVVAVLMLLVVHESHSFPALATLGGGG